MSRIPGSFVMMLRRRYRVYFNPQGAGWYVAYHDGSKRQRRSLGVQSRPDAEQAVKMLDEPPTAAQQVKHRASWGEVQKAYLQHKASLDRAASTLESYQTALNAFGTHIRGQGAQYIDEVNLGMLEAFKEHLVKELKLDPSTAYHTAIIVKGAFKWASRSGRGYLAYNPAVEWETPAPVKSKRDTYTAEDVSKMESGVRTKLRPIVTTLAWTGMRISELVNLRWQDVDLERRLIHVRVQDEWRPKAKRDRTVPLHPAVEAAFRQMPVREYVFANSKGEQLLTRSVLRALKAEQAKLGMKVGDLHAFRRFFATTMIRNGVDVETVRQWGGWKSFNTMLRYLADLSAGDSVKALDLALTRMRPAV